ncbi:MAG: chorismate synthase [Thermoplasmata archaeon]|nr:chorismate synthase [Thermoplasmata archaeon]
MMRFGTRFRVTLFGTSHGPEVGAVVEGVPKDRPVDVAAIQLALDRRRPVGRPLASRRREDDQLVVDQGIRRGLATGGPIRLHVANNDVRRSDYDRLRTTPRPGHADYPARIRYGEDADLSGGGIFSGRMTVGLVAAGAIASAWLHELGVELAGYVVSIGDASAFPEPTTSLGDLRRVRDRNEVGCPDPDVAARMATDIAAARRAGDSLGGLVEVRATGLPVGIGEPFFDSVESTIAHIAFAVPAVKGVEFGAGFGVARLRGSENNDPYFYDGGTVRTRTNHAGGILGGLSTGMDLVARFAVKPTASIAREQETVDLASKTPARIVVTGRHDPCIVPRAAPVLEAVVAIALVDLALRAGVLQ